MRRRFVADEAEPNRIEPVQDAEFPMRIPPFGGKRRKARDLGRIDCGLRSCDG